MGIHDILAVTVFLLIEYRITDVEKKIVYIYIYIHMLEEKLLDKGEEQFCSY